MAQNNSTIQCVDLGYQIDNKHLLKQVNCGFKAGQISVVLGKNGAGKSTLLKLLSKQLQPTEGAIRFNNQRLDQIKLSELALQRAVLAQQSPLAFSMSVTELVSLGADVQSHNTEKSIDELLALCDLSELAERDVMTLSGGELQRAQLARVLAQIWPFDSAMSSESQSFVGKWLLLDEWSNNLDLHHQQRFVALFKQWAQQGLGIIMVLHDLNLAAQLADDIKILQNAELITEGKPAEVLTEGAVLKTLDLKVCIQKSADLPSSAEYYSLILKNS